MTLAVEATGGCVVGALAEGTLGGAAGGAVEGAAFEDRVGGSGAAVGAAADGVGAGGVASRVGVDGSGRDDVSTPGSVAESPWAATRNCEGIQPDALFGSRTQS